MELELGQLDLRYEMLRKRNSRRERRLISSLAEHGQQLPVVVISAGVVGVAESYVLLDGYKRVRALRRLRRDTVQAMCWELAPADALLLERLMRSTEADNAMEQGWLLVALRQEFGLSLDELTRRFDRSKSWVSRRLALVERLPEVVQNRVQQGIIAPHAAMKFLVPLARANKSDCVKLATAIIRPLSIRQVQALCVGYKAATVDGRAQLLADPEFFLRAIDAAREHETEPVPSCPVLLQEMQALIDSAQRLQRYLAQRLSGVFTLPERDELKRAVAQAQSDIDRLFAQFTTEFADA